MLAGSILVRLAPYAIAVALASAAIGGFGVYAYRSGFERAEIEYEAKLADLRARAESERSALLTRALDAERELREVEAQTERRIAAARAAGRAAAKQTREIVLANPYFGGLRRPPELDRLRDDQLAALDAAARRATVVSDSILPAVRGADPDAAGGVLP